MGQLVNVGDAKAAEQQLWGTVFPAAAGTNVIRLFKNDIVPNETTPQSAFVEADFTGYASVTAAAADSTHLDPVTGEPRIVITTPTVFSQTGTAITNTVYGWWCENAGGTQAFFGERFDNPVLMDTTGKQIVLDILLYFLGVTGPDAYED